MQLRTIVPVISLLALSNFAIAESFDDSQITDSVMNIDDGSIDANQPGQFRGEGEHQCWHERFIGYKCTNFGVGYTDCNNAFFRLKQDNCCDKLYWQGKRLEGAISIDFKITKCTRMR